MPRHNGSRIGGHFRGRSGGNTRRVRKKGKGTYRAKQERWRAMARQAVAGLQPVEAGRKNTPQEKPQKPKEQGRGGRGGKGGGGK